jgi:hypothetical protein
LELLCRAEIEAEWSGAAPSGHVLSFSSGHAAYLKAFTLPFILLILTLRFGFVMVAQGAAYDWAFLEDIPGSRCGPEDGPWPRSFQPLNDNEVWQELVLLAKPQTVPLDAIRRADCINFQPCPRARTQDRYVVRQLNVHGHVWTLTGVFDGPLNLVIRPPY